MTAVMRGVQVPEVAKHAFALWPRYSQLAGAPTPSKTGHVECADVMCRLAPSGSAVMPTKRRVF